MSVKNLIALKVQNKEESLRYAYAFMKSKLLYIKECSFVNPTPTKHDKKYVFPRDIYSASYNEKNLSSWESFKTNQKHLTSPAFTCVGSLDHLDKKRVLCGLIDDVVIFNC